ncbi:hypothetical protein ACWOA0_01005 [Ignavigranum ruoffiae]|uniref:hypothetical protein n=1 Tax=Ignavigranum ruoffiae TaxID=89093 RepID=UPI003B0015AE
MTEKDIRKKIYIVIIILILLVGGYVISRPYLPTVEKKYQEFNQAMQSIFNPQPESSEQSQETSPELTSQSESPEHSETTEVTSQQSSEETSEETTTSTEQKLSLALQDYVELEFKGIDQMGEVSARFDKAKLESVLSEYEWSSSVDEISDQIHFQVNPDKDLANQDRIKVSLTQDLPNIFKNDYFYATVKGLKVQPKFSQEDLKKAIEISYQGFSGTGKAVLESHFQAPFEDLEVYLTDDSQNLKNGDQITIALTQPSLKLLEDQDYLVENEGKISYTVAGLEEPETLSLETLNRHVVVNFVGTSGVGQARIDTTFQPPYSNFLNKEAFEVENNGAIRNNDVVKIKIKPEILEKMKEAGLLVEEQGQIERQAQNMLQVAEQFKDLKDWQNLIKKIDEKIKQKYPDTLFGAYEIKTERYYYRPYHTANDLLELENVTQDGTIVGVYTITSYDRDKKQVRDTETEVFGFTDLFVNDENQLTSDKYTEYSYKYDNTYTLDSVFQILEGYNFKAVKLKD